MTTSPADPIAFTCGACGFHARLAQHYQGKAIRCPGCEAPQLVGVTPPASAPARPAEPGKVAFDCVACGHHADISGEYAGKVVWCPGCNAVQIVPKPEASPASAPTAPAAASEEPAIGGFLCQACGFRSRAIPSGVNGVVYCLACRAPQAMTLEVEARLPHSSAASADLSVDDLDALADAIGSITPVSLDDPLTADEHAALADLAAPAVPAAPIPDDPTPTPATQFAAKAARVGTRGAPGSSRAAEVAAKTAKAANAETETIKAPAAANPPAKAESAAPTPAKAGTAEAKAKAANAETRPLAHVAGRTAKPEKKVEPAHTRTSSVQVSQRGARKVYRRVDENSAGAAASDPNEATGATVQVTQREAKNGILGRLTSRLFRRK